MTDRADLARQIADRNDRCGHVESDSICLRPRNHAGSHEYEPINKVIPFQ